MTFLTFLTFGTLKEAVSSADTLQCNLGCKAIKVRKVRKVMRFKCFPDFGRWESQESHEFQMLPDFGRWEDHVKLLADRYLFLSFGCQLAAIRTF